MKSHILSGKERRLPTRLPLPILTILNILPFLWINFHWVSQKIPAICSLENILRDLSKKRLLNLTGKTNTELKESLRRC